jgi:hypothetical protein
MKKSTVLTIGLLTFSSATMAQLKHYFSYNAIALKDLYNHEKDKSHFPANLIYPNLSYKIESRKIGVELFFNDGYGVRYHSLGENPRQLKTGTIYRAVTFNIGIACHFNLLNKSYLKINPFAGLVKNWYNSTTLLHWFDWGGGAYELILDGGKESKIGPMLGTNVNVPIYKSIYANSNIRYSWFPGGQYNKQNFIVEIGLGYLYQNKKKQGL